MRAHWWYHFGPLFTVRTRMGITISGVLGTVPGHGDNTMLCGMWKMRNGKKIGGLGRCDYFLVHVITASVRAVFVSVWVLFLHFGAFFGSNSPTIYEIETLVTENENYEAQLIWTWLQLSHTDWFWWWSMHWILSYGDNRATKSLTNDRRLLQSGLITIGYTAAISLARSVISMTLP